MDFEKEKFFEEAFPNFYRLLTDVAMGVEEGKSEWDVVREVVTDCETAESLLEEMERFLKENPAQFEHVIEDVGNNYFNDTDDFLRWIEQIKRYVSSVKGRLCG